MNCFGFQMIIFCLVLFIETCVSVASDHFNILALFPYSGKSHFDVVEPLLDELTLRGHNLSVYSHFPKKESLANYHDFYIGSNSSKGINVIDLNSVKESYQLVKMVDFFELGLEQICRRGLLHPHIQNLLKSTDQYDLVISEMFHTDCFVPFAEKFQAPLVLVRTSAMAAWLSARTANPHNPSYVPGTTSGLPTRMSFAQRLANTLDFVLYNVLYQIYDAKGERLARQYFGEAMSPLQSTAARASLFLINSHFVSQYAKPTLPNVKEIAGLHLKDAKPLSQDLESWMSSEYGVVYMNLGSMIKPSTMDKDKRDAFLRVFAELHPVKVLLRWDSSGLEIVLPQNVKLIEWAPQNDILHHPNVKLFIGHAGMLGIIEAIHAGIPMVMIPMFGDQESNAMISQEKGLGLVLQYYDINYDSLNLTIREVLFKKKYYDTAKILSQAFRDRPMTAREEAAFWVEYVARQRQTIDSLMHTPSRDLYFHQYFLLDVVAFLASLLVMTLWLISMAATKIRRLFGTLQRKHLKTQ
ncbi:UDP-glucuronosyltransferase 2B17-like [Trichogramma pretiosum]|uniref:UDP-glucuronosyltransferase 2B17-like n=1 Tax=Trichogramma pretiosum TaxID=7493 RepID=UPI0006C9642A|nr:UDP-glucuronosyltransferase 2B17-like [Trichogramma pretiosum]